MSADPNSTARAPRLVTSNPLPPLSIVQHNCLGSWSVFLSLFNSLKACHPTPQIIAIQDPPVWNSRLSSFYIFTVLHPPATKRNCHHVATYIHQDLLQSASVLPCLFDRLDTMAINIHSHHGLFGSKHKIFRLYNSYSVNSTSCSSRTLSPQDLFPIHSFPTITMGDFNLHHPLLDPLRELSSQDISVSASYFDRAADLGFSLLNVPGIFTRFPFDSSTRPGVLDISFANPAAAPFFQSWDTSLPSTGSDHVPVTILLSAPLLRTPPPTPNWDKTAWDALKSQIASVRIPSPPIMPTNHSLSTWFDRHLSTVSTLLLNHTPKKRPSFQSKPWWTDQLSSLRRAFHSASRRSRKLPTTSHLTDTKNLKNKYFHAIKQAKASHWKQFLATVDSRSIWTAKKLAVGRPPDRFPSIPDATTPLEINDALLLHFFPPKNSPPSPSILRPFKHVPLLDKEEIQRALSKSSNSSAPGPDQIPYGIWKKVYSGNPDILISLLNPLILYGFHPLSLKKANGVVLSKPGKPDYSSPSSFRIIVLLKTVSKILERIIANRLSLLARLVGLIHPNQCGSLPGLSTFNACASLSHELRALQRANCKASTLFLDIKGGFDNVSSSHLSSILRQKGVSAYMVAWISSFLTNRQS